MLKQALSSSMPRASKIQIQPKKRVMMPARKSLALNAILLSILKVFPMPLLLPLPISPTVTVQ